MLHPSPCFVEGWVGCDGTLAMQAARLLVERASKIKVACSGRLEGSVRTVLVPFYRGYQGAGNWTQRAVQQSIKHALLSTSLQQNGVCARVSQALRA